MSNFIQVTPFLHVEYPWSEQLPSSLKYSALKRAIALTIMPMCIARQRASVSSNKGEPTVPHQATAASRTISTFVTSMGYMRNSGPSSSPLPKGDVYGPVDQTYGQRELLVLAPDHANFRLNRKSS